MLLFVTNGQAQTNNSKSQLPSSVDSLRVNTIIQDAAEAWAKGQNKEHALTLYTKAYELSLQLNYYIGCINALNRRANLKRSISLDLSAIVDYKTALAYGKKINRIDLISEDYLALMHTYFDLNHIDSALQVHVQLMKLLEHGGSRKVLFHSNYTLASYLDKQDTALGVKYRFEALEIAREENDPMLLVEILTVISKSFYGLKPSKEDNQYANEALWIANNSGDEYLLGLAFNTKATLSYYSNQIDSTLFYCKKAISVSKGLKSINNRILALQQTADAFEAMKDFKSQLYYLRQAYVFARKYNNFKFQIAICEKLAQTYKILNQPNKAFEYMAKFAALKDSFFTEQNIRASEEFGIKYKVAESEKLAVENKLKISEKENQLQKSKKYTWYSIGVALIAILVAIIFFLNYWHKNQLHKQQLQGLEQEKELQLLHALMQGEEKERSRIAKDLHDGVAGMLAAAKMQLSSLSIKNQEIAERKEFQQALKLLDDSTHEVRMTSHNLMPEVLLRHGVDEAIRRFCQNISNDSLLDVRYESLGEPKRYIDTFELSVYRIVQELLNNVVKHSKATEAVVQLSESKDAMFIFIEDNGIGFQQPAQKEGMGLQSLQSRIKAMNGRFEVGTSGKSGVNAYLEFNTSELDA